MGVKFGTEKGGGEGVELDVELPSFRIFVRTNGKEVNVNSAKYSQAHNEQQRKLLFTNTPVPHPINQAIEASTEYVTYQLIVNLPGYLPGAVTPGAIPVCWSGAVSMTSRVGGHQSSIKNPIFTERSFCSPFLNTLSEEAWTM